MSAKILHVGEGMLPLGHGEVRPRDLDHVAVVGDRGTNVQDRGVLGQIHDLTIGDRSNQTVMERGGSGWLGGEIESHALPLCARVLNSISHKRNRQLNSVVFDGAVSGCALRSRPRSGAKIAMCSAVEFRGRQYSGAAGEIDGAAAVAGGEDRRARQDVGAGTIGSSTDLPLIQGAMRGRIVDGVAIGADIVKIPVASRLIIIQSERTCSRRRRGVCHTVSEDECHGKLVRGLLSFAI